MGSSINSNPWVNILAPWEYAFLESESCFVLLISIFSPDISGKGLTQKRLSIFWESRESIQISVCFKFIATDNIWAFAGPLYNFSSCSNGCSCLLLGWRLLLLLGLRFWLCCLLSCLLLGGLGRSYSCGGSFGTIILIGIRICEGFGRRWTCLKFSLFRLIYPFIFSAVSLVARYILSTFIIFIHFGTLGTKAVEMRPHSWEELGK